MIKKLFKQSLLVCGALLAVNGAQAQTTVATVYTNTPPLYTYLNSVPGGPAYTTFKVENANSYPILITDVGTLHVSSWQFPAFPPYNTSSNGATYNLWFTKDQLNGPAIISAPLWTNANVPTVYSGGSSFGVEPIFKNLSILVPGKTTFRVAVICSDTMLTRGGTAPSAPPAPIGFTAGGVRLYTVDTSIYVGFSPGGPHISGDLAFEGNIKFFDLKPPTISVNPKPACLGDSVVLTATAGAYFQNPVYTWYDKNNVAVPGVTGDRFVIYGMDASKVGTYCATVTGSNTTFITEKGCGEVTLSTPPPPKFEGKVNYCLNEPFLPVTVLGPSPLWYYTETGGSSIPANAVNFNTTTPHKDTFWVSQTVNGCESPRTMVVYSAAPKPNVPIVTTPTFYCENSSSVPVTANGQELKWYYDPTGGLASAIAPIPNTTKKDTFYYYVSQTIDGCESNRARMQVVVTFRPNGLILTSRNELCQGDTFTLAYYGSAFPTSEYGWVLPPFAGFKFISGAFEGPLVVKADSAGTHTIGLTVGNSECRSELYTQTIKVDPVPQAVIEVRPNICEGQTELISLSSFSSTIDSFEWSWDGGTPTHYATDQGPYGILWGTPGPKQLTLRLVDELCANTVYDSTYVHAKPDATFTVDGYSNDRLFCNGDSIRMTANTIVASSKYSWSPTRFFDTYSSIPTAYARVDFKSMVKLSVTDEFGCFNSDSVAINTKSCCEVIFPSAFTPNNDGKNDIFRPVPQVAGQQRFVEIRTFKVVNRYGQVVYEAANERGGWDGTLNGKPQDAGTYFYYLNFKCDGKTNEQKGEIVLVR